MRYALAIIVATALSAIPVKAAVIRLFFAPEGVGEFDPLGSVRPTYTIPVILGSDRLYIWAEVWPATPAVNYVAIGYTNQCSNYMTFC